MYDDREGAEKEVAYPLLFYEKAPGVYFQARYSINIEKNSSTLARGSRPRVLYTGADRKRETDTRAMMIIAFARARARVVSHLETEGEFREIHRSFVL